ncbi:hypothetical protein RJ639_015873 [Escallonia herrerae]|uniref:Uncharacterized protein n=1 Tax=Escallonia herrerae TaxID=1293975 RepID=A0AA89ALG3_9ASTE|nr:hypothetical protein RJ639_015873 [Escallonia herrerae]
MKIRSYDYLYSHKLKNHWNWIGLSKEFSSSCRDLDQLQEIKLLINTTAPLNLALWVEETHKAYAIAAALPVPQFKAKQAIALGSQSEAEKRRRKRLLTSFPSIKWLAMQHHSCNSQCSLKVASKYSTHARSCNISADALVQLGCGGPVVANAATNRSGFFSIVLNPSPFPLSNVLSRCNLVVNTPLSTCNATLPAVGRLLSPLQLVGSTLIGLLNVTNLIPAGFQLRLNLG